MVARILEGHEKCPGVFDHLAMARDFGNQARVTYQGGARVDASGESHDGQPTGGMRRADGLSSREPSWEPFSGAKLDRASRARDRQARATR
jgi:hypothetical protein